MEDNENLTNLIDKEGIVICRMSVKMLECFVQQMQFESKVSMEGDTIYLSDCQVK